MTVTNFDSDTVANSRSTSATFSGWTFGSGSTTDIADTDTSLATVLLNMSGGNSIVLNFNGGDSIQDFYFKSFDGSDFKLNSFNIDNGPNGNSATLTVAGYRDGSLVVAAEAVNLTSNDASGNITYTKLGSSSAPNYGGALSFNSTFANIDEIRFVFGSSTQISIDDIDISSVVVSPTLTSATYNANTNSLVVTGTSMTATAGAANDIDVSKLTLTGHGGATYTLTSSNVEITSATQFTVPLNTADQINIEGILNRNGTSSVSGTTYNIAAAADWNPAQSGNADTTGNGVTVSNVQVPTITSATYDASTSTLTVTGSNLVKASGASNDINASMLTFTGESGSTYTLTNTSDIEITSSTTFTMTLSSIDKAVVNQIVNKNGTSSTGGTTYNLAAADNWNTVIGNTNIADTTGNAITVSNVATPAITSATYNASTGALVVTGTGFLKLSGATNDIVASKFTFTGEGGSTYTLTDSANIEITSGTAFTITLSATDKAAINQIANKNGTSSTGGTTYNLAAAEDWAAGANSAVTVADLTGNGITTSSVAAPAITSATYDASTGALVVTGTGFLKLNSASNDIVASKFTFTGEGGSTYTLTDSANVEITSGTAFTITLSATDKAAVNQIVNKNGTSSTGGTTYNLAAAEDWAAGANAAVVVADTTGNGITVSNVAAPTITSATYDYSSNVLTVTGSGFLQKSGASNDIDVSKLSFTGAGDATYTLASATNIEIASATSFSLTLTGADLTHVEALLDKNGTSSVGSTAYNLAAAEDWAAGADSAVAVADLTGNGITVSNYAAPTLTSATFDASTNVLTVTGTNFVDNSGASNDVTVSLLTLAGESGSYTLTSSAVDVTSATAFSVTLNGADQLAVHGLLNKNGTASSGATTYNIAAAEDWMAGSAASITVADLTGNGITVNNVQMPTITSATYDSSTGILAITGSNLFRKIGASNDIDISTLTLTGGTANATYTITSASDVEITSDTSFSVTLSGADKTAVDALLDQTGTTSSGGTTYNLAAANHWLSAADSATNISDTTNAVTVSTNPRITSATYDASSGTLVVTGTNLQAKAGASNDIDASLFTFTGEGSSTYTLTDSADVDITSATAFTITLSATDKTAVNQIANKNGTVSTDGTTYNLAAADDWNTNATNGDTADAAGNSITASNVVVPAITSATYNASTGALVVTGTGFLKSSGTANDIDTSKFTFTGEGGATYTLINSADVDITSGSAFTVTLSSTDKAAVNQIINKNGTVSTDSTTYNLAAAEDWAAGANAAVNVIDATGNAITASNVTVPTIASATYNTGTGALAVTGSGFAKTGGATNDIDASKFTFTGEGGATYTLTDTADVEITSGTAFTLTLSSTDKAAINLLLNKAGTASDDTTTYNLAAAEDWVTGADAAVTIADTGGNGITVSFPSSGGGGSSSDGGRSTTTVDGTPITTTTRTDGTVVIEVPVIQPSRQDDPGSLLDNYADIPVTTDAQGNPLLTVSLPVGTGLTTHDWTSTQDPAQIETDILAALTQVGGLGRDTPSELVTKAQQFLAQLPNGSSLSVHTITPHIAGNPPPALPIIIDHSAASTLSDMIVIDARQLPSGTVIQLDTIALAFIIGAARITGGSGQNFAVGDDQDQFIVLGDDDDILFGSGGEDTVGSLGGNDQTFGDAGDDTVYGGTGDDVLSGGTGNDRLNGGLGFDSAIQAGQLSNYQIAVQGNTVTLTQDDGETDTLTDVESIRFATGPSLVVAYSETEAVAHHLARTWLGRDLTATEGSAVQDWGSATTQDILLAFRNLPKTAPLLSKTDGELLAGWDSDPTIILIETQRNFTGGDANDQGYLPLGLAMNADGGTGYDVLHMPGGRSDVHLEFSGDRLELTQLSDGAMLSLKNAEMIAFDDGDTVVIAHDETEAVLARLAHSFLNRDVTSEEWQSGREALAAQVSQDTILAWLQQQAGLQSLSNTDFTQTIYMQTLGRSATAEELDKQLSRLQSYALNRDDLAVEVAQGAEAAAHLVGSVMLQHEWV